MKQQQRQRYPTDLTDAHWTVVERAMPGTVNGRTGTQRRFPARELWNAIFYRRRTAARGGRCRMTSRRGPPVWQQKTGPPREARIA